MAVGLRARRHSWACPTFEMTEGIHTVPCVKKVVNRNIEEVSNRQLLATMKRRSSAFDVLETITFKKNSTKIGRPLKPRRITLSQLRFLEWFRRRRQPGSKSIANLDIAGLLDLSGEKFRSVALGQAKCEKFCIWYSLLYSSFAIFS